MCKVCTFCCCCCYCRFLTYPGVVSAAFSVLLCRHLHEGLDVLMADYAVRCSGNTYSTYEGLALGLVALAALVPLVFLRKMTRAKRGRREGDSADGARQRRYHIVHHIMEQLHCTEKEAWEVVHGTQDQAQFSFLTAVRPPSSGPPPPPPLRFSKRPLD